MAQSTGATDRPTLEPDHVPSYPSVDSEAVADELLEHALALARQGQARRSIAVYREAIRRLDGVQLGLAHLGLGGVLSDLGDVGGALEQSGPRGRGPSSGRRR